MSGSRGRPSYVALGVTAGGERDTVSSGTRTGLRPALSTF
jgi:hypothetical protein